MKIEEFKYENVNPDGTFKDELGSVKVKGGITMSNPNGGCSIPSCKCSEGHWISIGTSRSKDGVVKGLIVHFDNNEEMESFISQRELST